MNLAIIKVCTVVFALIGFLLSIRIFAKKYHWHPEWQRKVLHVGLGLTAICFPWLFSNTWEVIAVCTVVIVVLLFIRTIPSLRNNVGASLYGVKRSSLGELLFALVIVLLFLFADGQLVLYVIPLAILTISDTFAALIGTHFGKKLFAVVDGNKSWEGTVAFAAATFIILFGLLIALTNLAWTTVFMIATIFSVLGALIEAVSWHGLDNLFVPLAAFLFLNTFLYQSETQLLTKTLILGGLVGFGLVMGPKSQLNTHALMAAIISVYFFWLVGGIAWVIAPSLVFLCHIFLVNIQGNQENYTISAVLSVTSGGFFWLLLEKLISLPYGFFLFTLALAIHLQIIVLLRLKSQRGKSASAPTVILISLISGTIILSTALIFYQVNNKIVLLSAFGLLIMIIGGISTGIQSNRLSKKRWLTEALFALFGSASTLIPIWIMESA